MVCHETYKDKNNNWLSPDEVEKVEGKFVKKINTNENVIVGPSESMSKSKKNVIDPEFIIKNYGADAVRLFILSDSPPEKDVQWSEQGMVSSYKFIQKLWTLHNEIKTKIYNETKDNFDEKLKIFTNQTIAKITSNLEKFNYNVIIANMYETYNYLINYVKKNKDIENLKENYVKILICLSPVIPHFSNECLEDLKERNEISWPSFDKNILQNDDIKIVIQINGKKRSILKVKKDTQEKDVLELIKKDQISEKYLDKKDIKKVIFVKNRLMNILIND